MSLHDSRMPSLRDELEAQARAEKEVFQASAAKLEALEKAKGRAAKEKTPKKED